MLELIIVVILLYVSYKLTKQEGLIQKQNDLIEELREMQENCRNHVERLENIHNIVQEDRE